MSAWHKLKGPMQRRFRRDRAKTILEMFPGIIGSTVVDIGGSWPFWNMVDDILKPSKVLIYNLTLDRTNMGLAQKKDKVETHMYDGKRLPIEDQGAKFVLCNSVIEHVPLDQRADFAKEVARVGENYVVQTPSFAFPIEPHFVLPGLHWLPRKLARTIVPISPFALLTGANAKDYFDETQLLRKAELQGYFPDADVMSERVLGIPKSNLAIKKS